MEKLNYFLLDRSSTAKMGASKSKIAARKQLSSDEIIAKFSHLTSSTTVDINIPQGDITEILEDIRASLLQIDHDLKQLRQREGEQKRVIETNEREQAEGLQGVHADILKIYRANYERTRRVITYMLKVRFILLSILAKFHLKMRGV